MTNQTLRPPPGLRDHHLGSLDAPVVLVEYGDFQCPFCAQAEPVFEQILTLFGEEVGFVFRQFPLTQIHPHAEIAALAAEAADIQGKFWPMHHFLFENYDQLSETKITHGAEFLLLDVDQFRADWKRDDLRQRIQEDFRSGVRSGVNGTPSVFFNGVRYDQPLTSLSYAIEGFLLQRSNAAI